VLILLRKTPKDPEERTPSYYLPEHVFDLTDTKVYKQQFADIYFLRLTMLKPVVIDVCEEEWQGYEARLGF